MFFYYHIFLDMEGLKYVCVLLVTVLVVNEAKPTVGHSRHVSFSCCQSVINYLRNHVWWGNTTTWTLVDGSSIKHSAVRRQPCRSFYQLRYFQKVLKQWIATFHRNRGFSSSVITSPFPQTSPFHVVARKPPLRWHLRVQLLNFHAAWIQLLYASLLTIEGTIYNLAIKGGGVT